MIQGPSRMRLMLSQYRLSVVAAAPSVAESVSTFVSHLSTCNGEPQICPRCILAIQKSLFVSRLSEWMQELIWISQVHNTDKSLIATFRDADIEHATSIFVWCTSHSSALSLCRGRARRISHIHTHFHPHVRATFPASH